MAQNLKKIEVPMNSNRYLLNLTRVLHRLTVKRSLLEINQNLIREVNIASDQHSIRLTVSILVGQYLIDFQGEIMSI